ncbi:hypothetical protein THAOC_11512 [Thalassiosira oceanica]|uniref:MYND-type domain-containing protein n=1 Tax=Thalassiosira oceanica TaxID=159749 RepID=K0SR12_THAOC|nr:hypothetical protein THAOC_11512 [Thalassiosira oceanica]|eukprot:EJK67449.1 hypothetical protein THAOC_11512 [Thalassiosira oceanica]
MIRPFPPALPISVNMSCVPAVGKSDEACANCGKHGSGAAKLKICTACRVVKYCSVDCQKAHRKQHKRACKQRAAELEDERLYNQGHERPEGDSCPICALPIPPSVNEHSGFNACCMKRICLGCNLAAKKRGMAGCPFCRTPSPENEADVLVMVTARVEKKDPAAINFLGEQYCFGNFGLQMDMQRAVGLWTDAAELGSVEALFNLGTTYYFGKGVGNDETKAVEFYKKAAMKGNIGSRYQLGWIEGQRGNDDRAARHLVISAKMGDKDSVETIQNLFRDGIVTKEQYAEALKGYQDALKEMKSHDRDEAKQLGLFWVE